jgi:RecG-like helicase
MSGTDTSAQNASEEGVVDEKSSTAKVKNGESDNARLMPESAAPAPDSEGAGPLPEETVEPGTVSTPDSTSNDAGEGHTPSEESAPDEKPVKEPLRLLPPLPVLHVLGYLESIERLLRHSLREEGAFLWDASGVSIVFHGKLEVLSRHETPDSVVEQLKAAREKIVESSQVHWSERKEPFEQALDFVLAAKSAIEAPRTHPKMAELLLADQEDARVDFEGSNNSDGRRGPRGGRNRRGRERADGDGDHRRGRDAERRELQWTLGHESHTGASLSTVSHMPDELIEALANAGISTIAQLLLVRPVEHEKITVDTEGPTQSGETIVHGTVLGKWTRVNVDTPNVVRVAVATDGDTIWCEWADSVDVSFAHVGRQVCLIGSECIDGLIVNPVAWRIDARGVVRRPKYGIDGVDDSLLRPTIRRLIGEYVSSLKDSLPKNVITLGRVKPIREAIRELHIPTGGRRHGVSRMVFEELFRHQLVTATKNRKRGKGFKHPIAHDAVTQLQIQHGIDLTDDQEIAFDEIRRDLMKPVAMTRLLQGDVGSGKAVVALLSAVMVASTRTQVLFLAPDHLAAEHRYMFAEPLLRSIGLVPQLITHTPTPGQLDALKRGQANMVFATHSLLESKLPQFNKLGLVVVEERSSFGVVSRDAFSHEKSSPDILVVTSVPIPSSLAFTIFADHDISVLSEGGGSIVSNVVAPADRDSVYVALGEAVKQGQQAYIVFPMRGGSDVIDREKARVLTSAMEQEAFPGAKVGLFHGSMTRDERTKVYEKFVHREIDVLVATTGIEDAPEIENASVMMVENADHYDLVRLYRLKGHVATGGDDASVYFVLSKKPSAEGVKLVEMVAKETDAFTLAERDRKVRGDKALLGEKASKLPDFNWADPALDRGVLIRARQVVNEILFEDPRLHRKIYRDLVEELGLSISDNNQRRRRGGSGRGGSKPNDSEGGQDTKREAGDRAPSGKGRNRRKRGPSRRKSN